MDRHLLLALLLSLASLSSVPAAEASDGPATCSATGDLWTCSFRCRAGDRVSVFAHGAAPGADAPRVSASCGGASAACEGAGGCTAHSASLASADAWGTCVAETPAVRGTCAASDETQVLVILPPLAAPGFEGGPLSTPRVERFCTPLNLLCVGPVSSVPLGTVPSFGATPLVSSGAATADADVESEPGGPQVEWTDVGPVELLGPPVPVTLCVAPCPVPSGVGGAPSATLHVEADGKYRSVTTP